MNYYLEMNEEPNKKGQWIVKKKYFNSSKYEVLGIFTDKQEAQTFARRHVLCDASS